MWSGAPSDLTVLALLAGAMRIPFHLDVLYHWDSVLYARALAHFDVSQSQPHPPGYLLYVGAARLLQLAFADANASLAAVSLIGAVVAVIATYALGRLLFGRGAAWLAALLLAAAPTFWFYSGVAYPYTVLAGLSTALAALVVRFWRGSWRSAFGLGLGWGVAAGFRFDLLIFLTPLVLAAAGADWRGIARPRPPVRLALGAALGVAAWLWPTAVLSGGWDVYWPLLQLQGSYVEGSYSLWAHGWPAFQSNGWQVLVYAWEGLGLALLWLLYGVTRAMVVWWRGGRPPLKLSAAPAAPVLTLWVVPPMAFYALVHIGDRGYSFSYLPGLCLLAGYGGEWLVRDLTAVQRHAARWWQSPSGRRLAGRALTVLAIGVPLGLNVAVFLFGTGRISAYEMRCLNRELPGSFELIQAEFDPADTLVFTSFFYQHARYYLPDYRAWWYDPLSHPVYRYSLPAGVRNVVVFGESLRPARQPNLTFYPLPCGRRLYYFHDIPPEAELVLRPPAFTVRVEP